jgi:geranylgeranyl diphosphate synthase type I
MTTEHPSPLDVEDLRGRVNKVLDGFVERQQPVLDAVSEDLDPIVQSARSILAGGKRLRPAFAYWGWRAAGGTDSEEIVTAVTSLELLQACALIHDDVMDGSDTRRGQPSVHRRFATMHRGAQWFGSPDGFGTGAAILLGDLALTWADELLFASGLPGDSLLRAKPVYDRMRTELMAGQYLDLLEQARGGGSVERALRVARYKAAKYTVEGPLHLGGTLAGADERLLHTFTAFGLPLGEAFQLRDDLLGVFGDTRSTGKPAGDDLREGKRTVLIAYAAERATPAQRDVLRRHLGDPHLSEDGVAALREVIVDTHAHTEVEQLICTLTETATTALAGVNEPAGSVLTDLAHAATSRLG